MSSWIYGGLFRNQGLMAVRSWVRKHLTGVQGPKAGATYGRLLGLPPPQGGGRCLPGMGNGGMGGITPGGGMPWPPGGPSGGARRWWVLLGLR